MSDPTPKFQPGEVAVLINGIGGRSFVVETTTFHGDMQRVHEYYVQPGDKKTRYEQYGGVGSPYTSLIKVPSARAAHAVIAYLNTEYERSERLVAEAKQEQRRIMSQAERYARQLAGDPQETS